MMKRRAFLSTFASMALMFALTACGGNGGGVTSFGFQPSDVAFPITSQAPADRPEPEPQVTLSSVFLDSVEVSTESGAVEVTVSGQLPTPCHRFAWEVVEDPGGVIDLHMWSEADPDQVCIQVLEPFSSTFEIGELAERAYTLRLAGQTLGELSPMP